MTTEPSISRRQSTIAEMARIAPKLDAARVVDSLSAGVTLLRDLLVLRLHSDVELEFGVDSLLAPLSLSAANRQVLAAGCQTEVYAAILISDEVKRGGMIGGRADWQVEDWVLRSRLEGDQLATYLPRLDHYRQLNVEQCRHDFVAHLHRIIPESVKTPLVLFRLFPAAVRIVAALAFEDSNRANELREEQCELLPAIRDCPACHGSILECGATCPKCGNPVWTFEWLQK